LVHQRSFLQFWLSFDCFWRLVHCWYSLGRRDDWYTNGHFCCFDCLLTVFDDWYTVGTVLVDMWRLVHQWAFLLFWLFLTIGVPIVTCLHRVRRIHKVPFYQTVSQYSDGYAPKRLRGTSDAKCQGGIKKIRIFNKYLPLSPKWYKTQPYLLWNTNSKPYQSFQIVPVSTPNNLKMVQASSFSRMRVMNHNCMVSHEHIFIRRV